ncbi:MAG: PQQ-binding-like beta-propeller repeat protein [Planctomycetota bacterium]|nr:PQQ-binding-like beta-propeller repeat protein [Planctomycetota bacterium]MED5399824.1 PQQ-binding-like beta-propeller repeat protein [Planctomycetota bacterium]
MARMVYWWEMPRWCAVALGLALATNLSAAEPERLRQWGQWRGPLATGVAPHGDPPIEWSETKNLRWTARLPGSGHSSPIVWGDLVFVTAVVPQGSKVEPKPDPDPGAHDNLPVTRAHKFLGLAYSRSTGELLWQRTLAEELPHEGGHHTGSLASHSAVTDGKRVFAFLGSRGLYCLGLKGKVVWKTRLGKMATKHNHGEGASPVLHGRTLVVNWDHQGQSKAVALDSLTGKTKWEVKRDEVTSWSSPIVVEHEGRTVVVISGTKFLRGYDLETGNVLWKCSGLSNNIVATPVYGDGMVFAGSSYDTRIMMGIRLTGASGDLSGSDHVAWKTRQRTPYVPSPLLFKGGLYFLRHYQGILTRLDSRSGEETTGPFRLGGVNDIYSSPVAAANRIYITDRRGATLVISGDANPKFLARNVLNDSFSASAAIVGRELFLRGARKLYCIAEPKAAKSKTERPPGG